jgi:hypothetical protein
MSRRTGLPRCMLGWSWIRSLDMRASLIPGRVLEQDTSETSIEGDGDSAYPFLEHGVVLALHSHSPLDSWTVFAEVQEVVLAQQLPADRGELPLVFERVQLATLGRFPLL